MEWRADGRWILFKIRSFLPLLDARTFQKLSFGGNDGDEQVELDGVEEVLLQYTVVAIAITASGR